MPQAGAASAQRHQPVVCRPLRRLWPLTLVFLFSSCRVGEAANPGPESSPAEWALGVINPTGLAGKEPICDSLRNGVWAISETHLTTVGRGRFAKGMKHIKSDFTYIVHGAPVATHAHSDVAGEWARVAVMASAPTRALPVPWDPGVWASTRVVTTVSLLGDVWVTGGVAYGFPAGATHCDALSKTEQLLTELGQHVVYGAKGPRFVAGDWNHLLDDIGVLRQWEQEGFQDVQCLALQRWGVRPRSTCKGVSRKDFLMVPLSWHAS